MLETIQHMIQTSATDGSAMTVVALAVAAVAFATVRSMYRSLMR